MSTMFIAILNTEMISKLPGCQSHSTSERFLSACCATRNPQFVSLRTRTQHTKRRGPHSHERNGSANLNRTDTCHSHGGSLGTNPDRVECSVRNALGRSVHHAGTLAGTATPFRSRGTEAVGSRATEAY